MAKDLTLKAHYDWQTFVLFTEQMKRFVDRPQDKLILDAGCGQRIPQTLLLSNFGYNAIGVDLRIPERYKILKDANFPLSIRLRLGRIKRLLEEYFQLKGYYRELERLAGRQLSFGDLDVRTMGVTNTEFPDGYFDIVVSHVVFEHLPDIDAACKELKRITKKAAYLFIGIHLFSSLSGGHHDEWQDPASVKEFIVPPWDHLRDQTFPVGATLNRLRFEDYKNSFSKYFNIADWVWDMSQVEPARKFLTPRIKKELSGYREDELLRHLVTMVLRN